MSKLELSARIRHPGTENLHPVIAVFQNGRYAGTLGVQREHAAEVLGILNAGAELVEACRGIINAASSPEQPGITNRLDSAFIGCLNALAKYESEVPA